MYYEEFVSCAKEQKDDEKVVRGCNAAGYVYNIIVRQLFASLCDNRLSIFMCQSVLFRFYPNQHADLVGSAWVGS